MVRFQLTPSHPLQASLADDQSTLTSVVLRQMGIYRGLINVLNTDNHLPEALIFALAGLISGMLQSSLLKHHFRNRFYWILASTLGWGFLILSTSAGFIAFIPGAFIYGLLTGLVFVKLLQPINPA